MSSFKNERRKSDGRRTGADRRQFLDPQYDGLERRSGDERRVAKERRAS